MRRFLNTLNELKLIDPEKSISTKEVMDILATDNPLVFDADASAYNLELEVSII